MPISRLLIALGLCALSLGCLAQSYPAKPLHMIVPFTPGGSTDIQGRWAAQHISAAFGQPVIVENRAGAGGVPGSDAVAKAAPDGYTLLAGNPGPLTVAPSMTGKMPYDTLRDFEPIFLIAKTPMCLCVNPGMPVRTLQEFISLAKARDGKINYGSAGVGTTGHISTEDLAVRAGIRLTHVPYKGAAQFTVDLVNGTLDMVLAPPPIPLVKAGKLRVLGVSTLKRHPLLPEVPTLAEQGLVNYESSLWNGVLARAGTPKPIIARIHGVLAKALATAEAQELLTRQGHEPSGLGPQEYAAFLRAELQKFEQVARSSGLPKM